MFTATVPAARVLRLTSGSTSVVLQGGDGEPQDASGTVVATATRADGTAVFTSQSTTHGTTGVYSTHLSPTDTAELDLLSVDWYDGSTLRKTTLVEIVGGFYFTVAEVRADPSLADSTKYSSSSIQAARNVVEWEAERIMGVAWVPRFRWATLNRPSSGSQLYLPDPMVRSVRLVRAYTAPGSDPVDYTGDEIADLVGTEAGLAVARSGAWSWCSSVMATYQSVQIGYEHGFDAPAPDVKDAALLHLRDKINRRTGGLSDRATTQTNEFGTVTLATAGRDGFETGIPDVDAVYGRHDFRTPGIG